MSTFFDTKCQLLHIAASLRQKGLILGGLHRFVRLMGLGIAPFLILAAVRINDKEILTISLVASGLLSLVSWVWSIHSLIYATEKHLAFCQNYPVMIEARLADLESGHSAPLSKSQMTKMGDRATELLLELKKRIEDEHLTVPDWVNVKAQQTVMSELDCKCASCGKKWAETHLLNRREIRKRLKNRYAKAYCSKCGQRIK